jgi:hypothetical protein
MFKQFGVFGHHPDFFLPLFFQFMQKHGAQHVVARSKSKVNQQIWQSVFKSRFEIPELLFAKPPQPAPMNRCPFVGSLRKQLFGGFLVHMADTGPAWNGITLPERKWKKSSWYRDHHQNQRSPNADLSGPP